MGLRKSQGIASNGVDGAMLAACSLVSMQRSQSVEEAASLVASARSLSGSAGNLLTT